MTHLLIITPIYPPSGGGAATYYGILSRELIRRGGVDRVTVITERVPGCSAEEFALDGRLHVVRMFPHRAGGRLSKISQYVRYAYQNIQYFLLPRKLRMLGPHVVLVHSSFHNYPNMLSWVIPRLARSAKIISDVRDHLLPVSKLGVLSKYHLIIACSENILSHLARNASLATKVCHIPVLQESLVSAREGAATTLGRYGLSEGGYLLFAGLIKGDKGIEQLVKGYAALRAKGVTKPLVVAGLVKDGKLAAWASTQDGVRFIGPLPRNALLDLIANAALNINLSPLEGMPRVSLEAIALGARVMLPAGIPEFSRFCPQAVMESTVPSNLAEQMQRLMIMAPCDKYPMGRHGVNSVLEEYVALFQSIRDI